MELGLDGHTSDSKILRLYLFLESVESCTSYCAPEVSERHLDYNTAFQQDPRTSTGSPES